MEVEVKEKIRLKMERGEGREMENGECWGIGERDVKLTSCRGSVTVGPTPFHSTKCS
jgi:hypothetical protein